ncbi:3',5'-cyclic-nucleotide phosphodiesterase [Ramlibacter rhizophilus]|uniref:3',5'-cyclic-nucleotide phosphodiesterase n=1 Tax=Ramlibacter rhizophilus TaxID=1781167 RepID=A0A4Z0BHG0_9BURK|nr:3',5'-cyclic-nucleotide phosphodiesterase [Ramlibacter rhizophilus]TFY97903.1 3',5'-cyclic-nucleotide phosphodiesterase [Ramlibacter rhizophilus]
MKVRVLGCSGAIARDCRTTSFLVDEDILVDAGTGVGDLSLDEMAAVTDVFLTHSHLDHVAALPLMLDAVGARRTRPVRVHALDATVAALQAHVFNDVIWPDFTRLPHPQDPFLQFHALAPGEVTEVRGRRIEALPALHSVPAVGYAVSAHAGCWVFSGDTTRNPAFWRRVNELDVAALVIETAFSNRERDLARRSQHLSPHSLAEELDCIAGGRAYPIYITHTKPAETELIMSEIARFDAEAPGADGPTHDIRWLVAGQVLEL